MRRPLSNDERDALMLSEMSARSLFRDCVVLGAPDAEARFWLEVRAQVNALERQTNARFLRARGGAR